MRIRRWLLDRLTPTGRYECRVAKAYAKGTGMDLPPGERADRLKRLMGSTNEQIRARRDDTGHWTRPSQRDVRRPR